MQPVWCSTRVRDLLDSLYRGYPSGAILLWETDEAVPLQDFAVSQSKQLPHWVKVSEVFKTDNDAPFLKRAGISGFDDSRYEYSQRLARLRGIRKYVYRMDVLERTLSYDEVTEIFVRVNSLGAKLRSSDLALAQITAKWAALAADVPGFSEGLCQDGL